MNNFSGRRGFLLAGPLHAGSFDPPTRSNLTQLLLTGGRSVGRRSLNAADLESGTGSKGCGTHAPPQPAAPPHVAAEDRGIAFSSPQRRRATRQP